MSLVSAPVWDFAPRTDAALEPTVRRTTGLPAATASEAAETNARPSPKSSQ